MPQADLVAVAERHTLEGSHLAGHGMSLENGKGFWLAVWGPEAVPVVLHSQQATGVEFFKPRIDLGGKGFPMLVVHEPRSAAVGKEDADVGRKFLDVFRRPDVAGVGPSRNQPVGVRLVERTTNAIDEAPDKIGRRLYRALVALAAFETVGRPERNMRFVVVIEKELREFDRLLLETFGAVAGGAITFMRCVAFVADQCVEIGVSLFQGVPAVHDSMTVGIVEVTEHVVVGIEADSAAPNDIVPGIGCIVIPVGKAQRVIRSNRCVVEIVDADRVHPRHDLTHFARHKPSHAQRSEQIINGVEGTAFVLHPESTSSLRVVALLPQLTVVLAINFEHDLELISLVPSGFV